MCFNLSREFVSLLYSLGSLVDMNPVVFQRQMFQRIVWQVQVLKVQVPDMGFKTFTPQGEALVLGSLLIWSRHVICGVDGENVSHFLLPALLWVFLICSICRSSASFQIFFSEEIFPNVAVESVHPWKMSLASFYGAIFNWNLFFFSSEKKILNKKVLGE